MTVSGYQPVKVAQKAADCGRWVALGNACVGKASMIDDVYELDIRGLIGTAHRLQ